VCLGNQNRWRKFPERKDKMNLFLSQAASSIDAEDGLRFMQEMIELSSQQQKEQQLPPRAVQIVSHPFFGRVVLTAGPAQFGLDLSKHKEVCPLRIGLLELNLKN
jgi:hypothetical protein